MTPALIDAAVALADTLAAENAALGGLDLARAASLLPAKERATEAFLAAQAAPGLVRSATAATQASSDLGRRLGALVLENRRLLERALAVQGRVVATVVRALPRGGDGFYRANGGFADSGRPVSITLSARA
ncbi:MAG: hypothetical protein ACP5NI_05440 [Acetobacteraceae bacterium]